MYEIFHALVVYGGATALLALLWDRPWLLAACFAAISLYLLLRAPSRRGLLVYAFAFVLGPAAELVGVSCGAWEYREVGWMLPPWLPFGWGIAVLVVSQLETALGRRSRRPRRPAGSA